jgi:hypothetical protein
MAGTCAATATAHQSQILGKTSRPSANLVAAEADGGNRSETKENRRGRGSGPCETFEKGETAKPLK